jgi:ubiquinone/menaquinone biosynthesis C-methylase UbiE
MSDRQLDQGLGVLGLSEELRLFVAEMPYERRPILDFLLKKVDQLPPGARVADVGSGNAPYRELFGHVEYVTIDWEQSLHEGARRADVVASAEAIPVPDESFDAVVLTQVLEHVPQPARVLAEQHRILRPAGLLLVTVPLVWELHEMPYDYFRYTAPGLESLLHGAGFVEIEVTPRNDCFRTLAQLMRNMGHMMGRAPDGHDGYREQAAEVLDRLSDQVAELAPLDANMTFPLGYAASATRPEN